MSKYLKKFETQAAYEAAQSGLILPNVSLIDEGNKVEYNQLENGIYAYYSDGSVKTYENADSNAIGVAVVTDNCRFVINKNVTNNNSKIEFGGYDTDLSEIGVLVTNKGTLAMGDFDGNGNTTKLINTQITLPAAIVCRASLDRKGYLGSLGEWNEVYKNVSEINNMITKIEGTPLNTNQGDYYWSSTLTNASSMTWTMPLANGMVIQQPRNIKTAVRVRAFMPL